MNKAVYNVSALAEYSVNEVISVEQVTGKKILKQTAEDRPYNDKHHRINSQRLASLGWGPSISLESGLAKIFIDGPYFTNPGKTGK